MTSPRVSILMPVYNVAPYLREAMDSILNQTFEDFELIILDDCSPDNSTEILDTYTDPRIVRYRGEKNVGLGNVLNIGMDMARGEFIARMDSDDLSTPERLAVQVAYLETHPDVDLCSCGMQLFGAKQETWVRETNVENVKITALFYSPILHASSMWRREAFERVGLRFRQEMVPAEDYDMWTRAMAAGLKLVNIPEVMYQYRIHPSQATTQTDKTARKDREVKSNYLRMLYPEQDMSDVDLLPTLMASDLGRIKQSVAHLLEANKRTPFFEQVRLEKRMWNYYYRQVVNCLAVHFEWRLVGELSWKWRIKWLLRR